MAIARQRIRLPHACWRGALYAWASGRLWDGDDVAAFEDRFAARIGVPAAVAVPSGRAGLQFLFRALDLEPGAEVICSAFGYPVVPYIAHSMGYRVRFVDCESRTLGMDPGALQQLMSERTRVVIATHLYGVPCRIDEIAELTRARGAALIEDCAHCYGASVGGIKAGAFGQAGYFSFETSKMINTMGGGMITTQDPGLAGHIREIARQEPRKSYSWLAKRLFRTTFEATVTHPLVFNGAVYPALRYLPRKEGSEDRFASGYHGDEVTLQGRMGRYTNYQARLGLCQMPRVEERAERQLANAKRLIERLRGKVVFQEPAGKEVTANYMLATGLFARMTLVCDGLLRLGVDSKHHYMRECSRMTEDGPEFPNAARAEREALHLPAYAELSDAQIDWVADKVLQVVDSVEVAGTEVSLPSEEG